MIRYRNGRQNNRPPGEQTGAYTADGERNTKRGIREGGRHTGEIKHDINRVRERVYEHMQRQKIEVAVSQGSCEQNLKSSFENLCCVHRLHFHTHKHTKIITQKFKK